MEEVFPHRSDVPGFLHPDRFYPETLEAWTSFVTKSTLKETSQQLRLIVKSSQDALSVSKDDWTNRPTVPGKQIELPDFLLKIYNVKCSFDEVFSQITFSTKALQDFTLGEWKGSTYGYFIHLTHKERSFNLVVSHAHLAGLRDTFNAWFSALIYTNWYRHKYEGFDFYKEVERFIIHGAHALKTSGQDFYKLTAVLPSLAVGCNLRDRENNPGFLKAILKDLPESVKGSAFFFDLIQPQTTRSSVHLRLEMSGMWKVFCHPNILMDESVRGWCKKGTEAKPGLARKGEHLRRVFVQTFSRQYFKVHHKWPKVKFTGPVPPIVKRSIDRQKWYENEVHAWPSSYFENITFDKTFEFDYHVDSSDLLSDKSIVPELDQWIHEYDRQAHRTLYGRWPEGPKSTTKRVVIDYLTKEDFSIKEIIDAIDRGEVPDSWKIIVAVQKEREFKQENARFFGKMTPELRLYQVVTEENIASNIFKYIKQQSMTMSEDELIRTILKLNAHARKEDTWIMFL